MKTLGGLSECGHCNRKPSLAHKLGHGWVISCLLCDDGQGLFYSKRELCVNEWNKACTKFSGKCRNVQSIVKSVES